LKNDLSKCINEIDSTLSQLKDDRSSFYNYLLARSVYDSTTGKLVDHLSDKGQEAERKLQELIDYWDDMLSQLKTKYQVALTRYNNLVSLCLEEDNREEEFTESEVKRRM